MTVISALDYRFVASRTKYYRFLLIVYFLLHQLESIFSSSFISLDASLCGDAPQAEQIQ